MDIKHKIRTDYRYSFFFEHPLISIKSLVNAKKKLCQRPIDALKIGRTNKRTEKQMDRQLASYRVPYTRLEKLIILILF